MTPAAGRPPFAPRPDHVLADLRFPRASLYDPAWVFENQMGPNVLWLAEEYGVEVWANDLWISATDNWARIRAAGMEGREHPLHAEAHGLPCAEGFFDAILSVDSYPYYGTDDLYLRGFSALARPGGRIGIVVPGLHRDFDGPVPGHLTRRQASGGVFWDADCWCFHTAAWWRALLPWGGRKIFPSDLECVEADANRWLTFVRVVARWAGD
jgi:SAM-dependent methyltransferase